MACEHRQRRPVLGQRLAADAEDGDALDADVAVGIDAHRPHIHERTGLDHGAAGSHQLERIGERRGHAGAVARPRRRRARRSPRAPARAALRDLRPRRRGRVSAPNSAAGSSRSGMVSTAISPPAPSISALARCISPSGPMPITATVSPKSNPPPVPVIAARVQPVRDRNQLGQRCELRRQVVGHAEEARAREQVHALRPPAEQVRRCGAGQRVAVVVEFVQR